MIFSKYINLWPWAVVVLAALLLANALFTRRLPEHPQVVPVQHRIQSYPFDQHGPLRLGVMRQCWAWQCMAGSGKAW